MASVENVALEIQQQAQGIATVLAMGTAIPPNFAHQADFPDFYFRVTRSEHMTELKEKFKRMCKFIFLKSDCQNRTLIFL